MTVGVDLKGSLLVQRLIGGMPSSVGPFQGLRVRRRR